MVVFRSLAHALIYFSSLSPQAGDVISSHAAGAKEDMKQMASEAKEVVAGHGKVAGK